MCLITVGKKRLQWNRWFCSNSIGFPIYQKKFIFCMHSFLKVIVFCLAALHLDSNQLINFKTFGISLPPYHQKLGRVNRPAGVCKYSRLSISRTRISRILRSSNRYLIQKYILIAFSNHNLALGTFLQVQITRSAN